MCGLTSWVAWKNVHERQKALLRFYIYCEVASEFSTQKIPAHLESFQKKHPAGIFSPFHCTFNLMLLKSSVSAVRKASQLDSFKWIRGTKGGGEKGPNCVFSLHAHGSPTHKMEYKNPHIATICSVSWTRTRILLNDQKNKARTNGRIPIPKRIN